MSAVPNRQTPLELKVSPERVALTMAAIALLLLLMHALVMYAKLGLGHNRLLGLVRMFDLFQEANLPTWYCSATLLGCALLLGLIGVVKLQQQDRFRWHWFGLASLFVLLSADETAMIHESVQWVLTRGMHHTQQAYSLVNVLYATVLVCVVLALTLHFLAALPRRTAVLFVASGAVFVGGGLGVDFVGEVLRNEHAGADTVAYAVVTGVEELLEMLGVAAFAYALLDYLRDETGYARIWLGAHSVAARQVAPAPQAPSPVSAAPSTTAD